MMFGEVVPMVVLTSEPVHGELSSFDAVLDPVEPRVHCFRSFDLDAVVGESVCCGVVGGDSGRL